ncbi:alpha/beta hydrolase [Bordetella bronchiseptica]|uniref:alpha/beta hydrolase n=1 Tax=Bordetella bronchiseptica TaxID=518 RepID=UPI001F429E9A|nr:alpha/beta hydrolase [Bordetella bronchiseptica]
MTEFQFELVARLLATPAPVRAAARQVLVSGQPLTAAAELQGCGESELQQVLVAMEALVLDIRGAFVLHSASDFRVTVGHHDHHRRPGAVAFAVGEVVRLVAHSTERWIPVRVLATPDQPGGYYQGVITEQLVQASRFQAGDRVMFGEDQVQAPAIEADRARRPARMPRRYRGW